MIQVLERGEYRLIETKGHHNILILDGLGTFAWINAEHIGEILVTSHAWHTADHIVATGYFRLYNVQDEPHLTDIMHLELSRGAGMWEGYLLPTGLPTDIKKKNRIIPTDELITVSPSVKRQAESVKRFHTA